MLWLPADAPPPRAVKPRTEKSEVRSRQKEAAADRQRHGLPPAKRGPKPGGGPSAGRPSAIVQAALGPWPGQAWPTAQLPAPAMPMALPMAPAMAVQLAVPMLCPFVPPYLLPVAVSPGVFAPPATTGCLAIPLPLMAGSSAAAGYSGAPGGSAPPNAGGCALRTPAPATEALAAGVGSGGGGLSSADGSGSGAKSSVPKPVAGGSGGAKGGSGEIGAAASKLAMLSDLAVKCTAT